MSGQICLDHILFPVVLPILALLGTHSVPRIVALTLRVESCALRILSFCTILHSMQLLGACLRLHDTVLCTPTSHRVVCSCSSPRSEFCILRRTTLPRRHPSEPPGLSLKTHHRSCVGLAPVLVSMSNLVRLSSDSLPPSLLCRGHPDTNDGLLSAITEINPLACLALCFRVHIVLRWRDRGS